MLATYRPVSCLSASTICRCITAIGRTIGERDLPEPHCGADFMVHCSVLYRFGGLIMTIASLKWSQKATATREVLASNDVRTFIANQLGVDVKRVTDEA